MINNKVLIFIVLPHLAKYPINNVSQNCKIRQLLRTKCLYRNNWNYLI